MIRVLIAAVAGAVVLFVWGTVSWTVLPWHTATLNTLPNEQTVVGALKAQLPHTGVYYFPACPADYDDTEAVEQWTARHKQGPIGLMFYQAQGAEPMPGSMFGVGFALDLIATFVMAWIVCLSSHHANTFLKRLGVATMLGILVAVFADLMLWNWMRAPAHYTLINAADHIVAATLAGIPIAAIIKPCAK